MVMVCMYVVGRFDSRECREYIYLEPPFSLVIYIYTSLLSLSLSLSPCAPLSLSFKQERKKKKVGIEIVTGDGDDLIVVDPRSSPVWLNAKIGCFLVKVGLDLTDILICR